MRFFNFRLDLDQCPNCLTKLRQCGKKTVVYLVHDVCVDEKSHKLLDSKTGLELRISFIPYFRCKTCQERLSHHVHAEKLSERMVDSRNAKELAKIPAFKSTQPDGHGVEVTLQDGSNYSLVINGDSIKVYQVCLPD